MESEFGLTEGTASINMTTQVVADMFVASDTTPAKMAPIMPPTSNKVDKSALSVGLKVVDEFM